MIDAFANPGPAHPARLGDLAATCALPDQYVVPDQVAALAPALGGLATALVVLLGLLGLLGSTLRR